MNTLKLMTRFPPHYHENRPDDEWLDRRDAAKEDRADDEPVLRPEQHALGRNGTSEAPRPLADRVKKSAKI